MLTCEVLKRFLIAAPTEPDGSWSSDPRLRAVNKAVLFSSHCLRSKTYVKKCEEN